MKKLLSFLVFISFAYQINGQNDNTNMQTPFIEIKNINETEKPVQICQVRIDVKVVGSLAVTTVDMIFHNPNNRILEGELQFPLAEGQSVSRFALDIDGKLREGVTVEKAKAQTAFESVVRKNIDPALLEKTVGNNFRTRIYPLPANGNRRIVIAYEQELDKKDNAYRFCLPVEYRDKLDAFDVNVSVFGDLSRPKTEQTPWGSFRFDKEGEAYIAKYSAKNYHPNGQIVFSVPIKKKNDSFIEKGKISNRYTFYTKIFPEVSSQSKKFPKVIDLYWDISGSMENRNFNLESQLLDNYLSDINNLTIRLYTFNTSVGKRQTFAIKDGDWSELKSTLQNMAYDGATRFEALDFSQSKADEILLFSDGLNNLGLSAKTGSTAITAINSSLRSEHNQLKFLASTTGGKYINLMNQTPDEAVHLLVNESFHLISADYDKQEIADFTTSGVIITPESGFSMSGRLLKDKSTITLKFGIGKEVLYTEQINLDVSDAEDYDNIVERVWAAKKISELDLLYDKNKKEIEELGKRYNIVTRNTSLIILETVEDYIQYGITPPEELLEKYNNLIKSRDDKKLQESNDKMNYIISLLQTRLEFWNTNFALKSKKDSNISKQEITIDYDIAEMSEIIVSDMSPANGLEQRIANISEESAADDNPEEIQPSRGIVLNKWEPDASYIKDLKEVKDNELYTTYLKLRKDNKNTPSFFLDASTIFEERGLKEAAFLILSNLAEINLQDYRLMRILGHRFMQLGYTKQAINMFEEVLILRPEDPQSYRDYALACEQNKDYQRAIELLYEALFKQWDSRFKEIEIILIEEMNHIIDRGQREGVKLDLKSIDERLIHHMPVDIRIVLNWDTDNSDMDLWVTDPRGEKCYYGNKLTEIGGMISADITDGYGPEEFLIKKAMRGNYEIQTQYYGTREQTIIGPSTIYLDIFTNYGRSDEKKQTIMLRLTGEKDIVEIGEVAW